MSHVPRVPGLPHTAPKYDKITEPVRAPVPAACIDMPSQGCKCYSQQGTLLPATPAELCKQIVRQGYFVDFDPEPEKKDDRAGERTAGGDSHPPVDQGSFEMPKRANERWRVSMADAAAAYRGPPAGRIDPNLRP